MNTNLTERFWGRVHRHSQRLDADTSYELARFGSVCESLSSGGSPVNRQSLLRSHNGRFGIIPSVVRDALVAL